jgi:hypothetical protein
MSEADIRRRFTYAPPDAERARLHERVRALCTDLALALEELLPDVPEKVRAVDSVDDACKHANAALARGPLPEEDGPAGTRAPLIPLPPNPTGSGSINTGGGASVHVYLDSLPSPHRDALQREQLARLRSGPIRA